MDKQLRKKLLTNFESILLTFEAGMSSEEQQDFVDTIADFLDRESVARNGYFFLKTMLEKNGY